MKTEVSVKKQVKEKKSFSNVIRDFIYGIDVKIHSLFKRKNNKVTSLKTANRKKKIFYTLILIFFILWVLNM